MRYPIGKVLLAVALALLRALDPAAAENKKTLRVVMHSGLRITDPIITTACIARNHGYMIYDTLFAVDEKFSVKPQMVKNWKLSDDKLTYTFTLRDGLSFHDGKPVTSEDVIASLQRWGKHDGMGQKLMEFTKDRPGGRQDLPPRAEGALCPRAPVTRQAQLERAVHHAERIAETPADKNVPEEIGSGPFRFVATEFQPGLKVVY